jgi:two-component SAPR family response regulator
MLIKGINVAIIDDEEKAIKLLREEIETFREPLLKILFTTTDPLVRIKKAKEQKSDILFLDIQMSVKRGIEVLHDLRYDSDFDCHIVFQTGYEKYTIDALGEAAFDYKNCDCIMVPPFDKLNYQIGRNKLAKFKEQCY